MSISFALEIILDCETIEKAHKAARKYIKQLENSPKPATFRNNQIVQAPSTQRLLDAQIQSEAPTSLPPMLPRIAGGEINNGDGTRGKKKW